jgi:hypothetical protein
MTMDENFRIQVMSQFDLRDLFAMGAMQGDWASQTHQGSGFEGPWEMHGAYEEHAERYYAMADAMLRVRRALPKEAQNG